MSLDTSIFTGRSLCQLCHILLLVKIYLLLLFLIKIVFIEDVVTYHLDGSELFVAFFTHVPLAHT